MEDKVMLRCPFCGGNKLFAGECGRKYDDDKREFPIYKVQCLKCGCRTRHGDSLDDAVKAWNSRPISLDVGKTFPSEVKNPELVQIWDDMTSLRIIIHGENYSDELFDIEKLEWCYDNMVGEDGIFIEAFRYISLAEIAKQIKATGYDSTILVITEDPMGGTIYRYGNYGEEWSEVGRMCGYA